MRSSIPDLANAGTNRGFSLVELVVVIILLGVLAAVALPRFLDTSTEAKVATLESLAGSIRSTAGLVQAKARLDGIRPYPSNPGNQSALLIAVDGRTTEVDWRNLCPESIAELGDALNLLDFMDVQLTGGLTAQLNNRYSLIGYDVPGFSVPTNQGCYLFYDSFGDPICTVTVVTADC